LTKKVLTKQTNKKNIRFHARSSLIFKPTKKLLIMQPSLTCKPLEENVI
jgi:hypothetical protein